LSTSTASPVTQIPEKFLKIYHSQINPEHNEQVVIKWCQPQAGPVTIIIFNRLGDKIITLADQQLFNAGKFNEIRWNGHSSHGGVAGSGIYIVVIQAPGYQDKAKIALIK